jgi:hypothetical protein
MELEPKVIDDKGYGPNVIASAIIEVALATKKLLESKLTRRAIVVLIRDAEPSLTLKQIELVLDAAVQLEERYVKKAGIHVVSINGTDTIVDRPELSYEDVCGLAYPGQDATPTVVYHHTDKNHHRGGTLAPGQAVLVTDGLRIDAIITNNA